MQKWEEWEWIYLRDFSNWGWNCVKFVAFSLDPVSRSWRTGGRRRFLKFVTRIWIRFTLPWIKARDSWAPPPISTNQGRTSEFNPPAAQTNKRTYIQRLVQCEEINECNHRKLIKVHQTWSFFLSSFPSGGRNYEIMARCRRSSIALLLKIYIIERDIIPS